MTESKTTNRTDHDMTAVLDDGVIQAVVGHLRSAVGELTRTGPDRQPGATWGDDLESLAELLDELGEAIERAWLLVSEVIDVRWSLDRLRGQLDDEDWRTW